MAEPWFAPKRFGYGAGLPIRWQGWALYAAAMACIVAGTAVSCFNLTGETRLLGVMVSALVPTLVLVPIARSKTDGGWRWRGGD